LIPPQFETPMLGLMPATFPPILRELPPPNLELFDLDDEFASEKFTYFYFFVLYLEIYLMWPGFVWLNLQINAIMRIWIIL